MDGFQDLPRQFGRVWSSKIFNGFEILLVVLGGSKKSMKWKEQEFYARAMAELPGRERGNVRYARLGLIKWLKYSPRKALRAKIPVRYQGLTLRFAVNVHFSFLNKLFGLSVIFGLVIWPKFGVLGFVAKQTVICSKNREV